ncbi:MAG: hypothetical protein U5N26_07035 [Candidatus Marinimicrobia bacterium]|nr:hypothetical protein [Candidatus Neomarinimicrobiota bacterium]
MKEKKYTIQGKKFTMGEMTLGQDKKLLQLFKGRELNFEELDSFRKIIDYLFEEEIVDDLLGVILRGDIESIDIEEITNSQLEEIISDFLSLNGEWISKLSSLLTSFLNGNLTDHSPNLKRKQSRVKSMTG